MRAFSHWIKEAQLSNAEGKRYAKTSWHLMLEVAHNRGILYDSDVVDACLKLFREKNFKLEQS